MSMQVESGKTSAVLMLRYGWIALVLLFVAIGFVPSYMDPDDSTVVAFHSQGENRSVQIPYSTYISGYDLLLTALNKTFLHNDEPSIHVASHILNIISFCVVLIVLERLVRMRNSDIAGLTLFFYILPFAIPEMFFWGLDITEGVCGLAFMISGYSLLIRQGSWRSLVIGAMLLGFGVSVRWEAGLFSLFVAADLILTYRMGLAKVVGIVAISLITFTISLGLSGYTLGAVFASMQEGSSYAGGADFSRIGLLAANVSMFTPASLLLIVLGLFYFIRHRSWMIPGSIVLVLSGYLIVTHGAFIPKASLSILFMLLLIMSRGFASIYHLINRPSGRIVTAIVVLVPWLIGVQVFSDTTAWGPAFELNQPTSGVKGKYQRNPDRRLKSIKIRPHLGSGFAIATPEGPRPAWGYLFVVVSDWKKFSAKLEDEKTTIVKSLIASHKKTKLILTDNRNSLNVVTLNRYGYLTRDAKQAKDRRFVNPEAGDTIRLDLIPKNAGAEYWAGFNADDEVRVYVTYSSLMSTLVTEIPNLHRIGPFSAELVTSEGPAGMDVKN